MQQPRYLRDGRAPIPTSRATSEVMSANKARDTGPELVLRRSLRALGIKGYRLHPKTLPGRPDIAFPKDCVAIFVHGCFWHRCPRCKLPLPKSHTEFWRAKFNRNKLRDAEKMKDLARAGWRSLVIWGCEISEDSLACANRVSETLAHY
jgi:DNA mismatch endonuclease (patch repair protein)